MRGTPARAERVEAAIQEFARRRHHVVTRSQLLEIGLGEDAIDYRLATGRLHRLHRGVYAYGRADVPLRGRWLAAVLACGADAVLSHRSAGALWGILAAFGSIVHVSSTGQGAASDPLVALHRTRSLPADERAVRDGIPVTSLPRTLVDLAATIDADGLRDAFEEADRLNVLQLSAVSEACARAGGRRGVGRLRALVAGAAAPDYTRSRFERRFLAFCREQQLPLPEVNAYVCGFEVDALWRRERGVLELDSWEFHGRTRQAFERDRVRDATLQLAGYRVYRLTWRRLENEALVVARELRAYLARDAAAPSV